MKAAQLRSLGRVFGAVSQVAEAELAALTMRIRAHEVEAARLRDALARATSGSGAASDLAAAAAWHHRLAAEARAADAAARVLEIEAAGLHERLKLAFGHERVVADLAERSAATERRERARRAEDNLVPTARRDQSSPASSSGKAGSPGME